MEEEKKPNTEKNIDNDTNTDSASVVERASGWGLIIFIIVFSMVYYVFRPQLLELQMKHVVRRAEYLVTERLRTVTDCDSVNVIVIDNFGHFDGNGPELNRSDLLIMSAEGCGERIVEKEITCRTKNYVSVSCDLSRLRNAYIVADSISSNEPAVNGAAATGDSL